MSAAAHNPAFAAKAGIPVAVAQEFHAADAGKKYGHTPGPDEKAGKRAKIAAALTKRA